MINVFIVDDDSTKLGDICSVLHEFVNVSIEYELDVKKALIKLQQCQYDLVILDIKLPDLIGKNTNENGGVHLLNCIIRTERIKKPTHIIGLTSYDDSMGSHEQVFQENIWALLKYSRTVCDWKEQLRNKINYLLEWKRNIVQEIKYNQQYETDFVIITAVERECKSVLELDLNWSTIIIHGDSTLYKQGIIKGKEKDYKIVLAQQHQMGMPAAGVLTMKLIQNFKPRYVGMLGIAAGKQNRVNLGDILIAAESWDYGSGKIRENGADKDNYLFEPEPHQLSMDIQLKEKLSQDFSDVLYNIRRDWNKQCTEEINTDIKIHVGALASGAAVIQDETVVQNYIDPQNRKLLGLDMETYAVYYAAVNTQLPKPRFFSIKSVCDFASKEKNDNYQSYAAFISAKFFYNLVVSSIFE